jgi:2-keto-4-pentenoate hydratase
VIQQSREEIAETLLVAYVSRQPVEPLTETYSELTVEDAYEIQLLQIRR